MCLTQVRLVFAALVWYKTNDGRMLMREGDTAMRITRLVVVGAILAYVAILLSGCGSAGGGTSVAPTGLTGRVTGADNPETLALVVDGQRLNVHPRPDGSFTIAGIPPGDHVISVVASDGELGAHISVETDDTGGADIGNVDLNVGGKIVGTVSKVEDDGALTPIEGVQVTATIPEVWILDTTEVSPDVWPPPDERPSDLKIVGFTKADGSYTLEAVPPGEYEVRVVVPGLEAGVRWVTVTPKGTATANFYLRAAIDPGVGTIEGQVLSSESGEPIGGALVTIKRTEPYVPNVPPDLPIPGRGPDAGPVEPWFGWYSFATLTDSQGNYHLNVPSGYMTLSVFAEGFDPLWKPITIKPDETLTLNVALRPMPGWPPPPGPVEPPLPPDAPEEPPSQ